MRSGFALVATVSVMALLVMTALAMLTLSAVELKALSRERHQSTARANARIALMLAINQLQKHAGPDRCVTARASILEDATSSRCLQNRNWLGVWSTTYQSGDVDWPVIGKAPTSDAGNSPYSRSGAYEDLRHTLAGLHHGAWRKELHRAWLVSQRSTELDVCATLDPKRDHVVEIVGRGALGDAMPLEDYHKNRVLVEKVDLQGMGACAWYVSDNNQKASVDPLFDVRHVGASFEASPRENPALVLQSNGDAPYASLTQDALNHRGKMLSIATASLVQEHPEPLRAAFREHYHHFTTYSPGLFVNTLIGGLRTDLTPLLLSHKRQASVDFAMIEGVSSHSFSSTFPIIPGPEHGVLGPSLGALRDWAQHMHTQLAEAEVCFASQSGMRMRPASHWPHGISDGVCFNAGEWAESAPKIHPVMTDCRWHYYFSHHEQRIRTHIIPRVCLWNPYNRTLKTSGLTVLMPNPFYGLDHGIHFFVEEDHVNDLKSNHANDPSHLFSRWIKKGGYVGGDVYKMRVNPFPPCRYLAFTLEPTSLAAGECHVFSPKGQLADIESGGVRLQSYQPIAVSANILSSSSPQGIDHFYFDHDRSQTYEIQNYTSLDDQGVPRGDRWSELSDALVDEIDLARVFDYQPEVVMRTAGKVESFPFVLKAGVAHSLASLTESFDHPTLQLINNGAGGASPTSYFAYPGSQWGSANQRSPGFQSLQTFQEAPLKDAPDAHQVGAKMLWLDESTKESLDSPLRKFKWGADHMVYNVCPIANWNVRAQLTTRSPASQCAERWFMHSMGSWLLQFSPYSPQDINDAPGLNASGHAFVKNPFGAAVSFPFSPQVVLFDLPSEEYGLLSLATLRHAMLSPYSWSPSYVVGHSLRDMHAPSVSTAHDVSLGHSFGAAVDTRWDYLIGGSKAGFHHGAYAKQTDSQGLLQLGSHAATRMVNGVTMTSQDDVLAYDIAYEVNHNLWDHHFISGMPLSADTRTFDWDPRNDKPLWNRRYQFNYEAGKNLEDVVEMLSACDGVNIAFWKNAEFLKNRAAFNVNSTSVEAWTAFLSGGLGENRPLARGELGDDVVSFARYRRPRRAGSTGNAEPDHPDAWIGSRQLSNDEVRSLAKNIVKEVKKRGPFVSIADFVNRRLSDTQNASSHMGAIDAAIEASGLNERFGMLSQYLSTAVVDGGGESDHNLGDFKESYRYESGGGYTTSQPLSKAWGLPGFLTQGDILEPLAPSLAVRGDTFTIRTYGESKDGDAVMARAWMEVVVERIPKYVNAGVRSRSNRDANAATDVPLSIDHATGEYTVGQLSEVNRRFGRKFNIKAQRWLSPDEI
ncbi:MAG: hypothetical protein KJO21_00770 [Verrucomicrobiae bacterium]|nr:hypothetical protein [Verrucomicrobiae bacterium]NNJ42066.1 hypothetical protein [Akkermansiaceae bacterium]